MPEMWFWLVAIMIAIYVVLDGFDLGAGALHLLIARNDSERRQVLASIGPIWDGNEVWLIAGAATLYFAFPALFAAAFSGFYLPLIMILWLLMLRGISIELRGHLDHPIWRPFWDVVFCGASLLLVVYLGVALGNVVRGVPMDAAGGFFLPLWTDLTPFGDEVGIIDWYTVPVTLFVVATLILHGALWVRYKTEGIVNARAAAVSRKALLAVVGFTILITPLSFAVQPQLLKSFSERPWIAVFPVIALVGLGALWKFTREGGDELKAFLASCTYVLGMLTSVVGALFPFVLPSNRGGQGLTVYNTATHPSTMAIGLYWWIPGMILALGYSTYMYMQFSGKVEPDEGESLSTAPARY